MVHTRSSSKPLNGNVAKQIRKQKISQIKSRRVDKEKRVSAQNDCNSDSVASVSKKCDYFSGHFTTVLEEPEIAALQAHESTSTNLTFESFPAKLEQNVRDFWDWPEQRLDLDAANFNKNVAANFGELSEFQSDLFQPIGRYMDLYYQRRTWATDESVRSLYCAHALNHVLKTRNQVYQYESTYYFCKYWACKHI